MERSNSISKDTKFHIFIEEREERRFLGTLCCAAEDVVRAGVILRGELYIKVGVNGRSACRDMTLAWIQTSPRVADACASQFLPLTTEALVF